MDMLPGVFLFGGILSFLGDVLLWIIALVIAVAVVKFLELFFSGRL